ACRRAISRSGASRSRADRRRRIRWRVRSCIIRAFQSAAAGTSGPPSTGNRQGAVMSKIIETIESEQITREVPDFSPGDTVVVQVKVIEGGRERLQAFEGTVIAKRNRGLNS